MVMGRVLSVVLERDKNGIYKKVSSEAKTKSITLGPTETPPKGVDLDKLKQVLLDKGIIADKAEVE